MTDMTHVYLRDQKWSKARIHVENVATHVTLCGLTVDKRYREVPKAAVVTRGKVCGNCRRTRLTLKADTVMPAPNDNAATKGMKLARQYDGVIEVQARVFRLKGSTDTYTVVLPLDKDLASTCTCMAAKTHPELMCKHQAAAFFVASGNGGVS